MPASPSCFGNPHCGEVGKCEPCERSGKNRDDPHMEAASYRPLALLCFEDMEMPGESSRIKLINIVELRNRGDACHCLILLASLGTVES